MSVNRASEVWKEIKPFAIRDMNRMLDNKAGDSGDDLYAIILYDESAQKIKYYSMSGNGLTAALAAASSGDIIVIPAGTLIDSISSRVSSGVLNVTSSSGTEITGLDIGSLYSIESKDGPWKFSIVPTHLLRYYDLSNDGGSNWYGGPQGSYPRSPWPEMIAPPWAESIECADNCSEGPELKSNRIYFYATTTSIKIRVSDDAYSDNALSMSWELKVYTDLHPFVIPEGVEVVGLGKNTIINTNIENNGILTNIQVTGTITGSGITRMVPNPNAELFSNQIKSLVATGTSPFSVESTTVNNNLNADLLDGEHANAFADATHNHTESDITDLDHDAVTINGIGVDLTGISDGDALVYDAYEDKLIPGEGGSSGSSAVSDLTDVDLTGLADGDVLVFDETSGEWLPETPASGGLITVEEQDGTPSVSNVNKIKVTNGTLTDDGSGVVSLDFTSLIPLQSEILLDDDDPRSYLYDDGDDLLYS